MLKKYERPIQIMIMAICLISIAYGMVRGEQLVVLQKAINICLECIGLG